MPITLAYWNELANQLLLVSSLLSGFSITVVANILVSDRDDKLTNRILKTASMSAGCFLVAVFAMVQMSMITTPGGYLKDVTAADFTVPRAMGIVAFMVGLLSLTAMISLSGWTKSKNVGRFTTAVGILTLLLILSTMFQVS